MSTSKRVFVPPKQPRRSAQRVRTLSFPPDRSIGWLWSARRGAGQWVYVGRARGDMEIEASHEVMLEIREKPLTSSELAYLGRLPKRSLAELEWDSCTDAGLRYIGHITSLRHLNLDRSKVTSKGFAHLSGLRDLRTIRLQLAYRFDGTGFRHLNVPRLQELRLLNAATTDEGLRAISRLKTSGGSNSTAINASPTPG